LKPERRIVEFERAAVLDAACASSSLGTVRRCSWFVFT